MPGAPAVRAGSFSTVTFGTCERCGAVRRADGEEVNEPEDGDRGGTRRAPAPVFGVPPPERLPPLRDAQHLEAAQFLAENEMAVAHDDEALQYVSDLAWGGKKEAVVHGHVVREMCGKRRALGER